MDGQKRINMGRSTEPATTSAGGNYHGLRKAAGARDIPTRKFPSLDPWTPGLRELEEATVT
jgi:hypothetical protein